MYCKVLIDVTYYVFIVGTLSPSTISAMDTTSVTIPTVDTTAGDISPSTSTNLCAISPSNTACIMAIGDDETGNDTICCICTYIHT